MSALSPLSRRLVVSCAAVIALFAIWMAWDLHGLRLWSRLGDDVTRIEAENRALASDAESLRRKVAALEGDPRTLERAAREELGYVRDDEVLFKVE